MCRWDLFPGIVSTEWPTSSNETVEQKKSDTLAHLPAFSAPVELHRASVGAAHKEHRPGWDDALARTFDVPEIEAAGWAVSRLLCDGIRLAYTQVSQLPGKAAHFARLWFGNWQLWLSNLYKSRAFVQSYDSFCRLWSSSALRDEVTDAESGLTPGLTPENTSDEEHQCTVGGKALMSVDFQEGSSETSSDTMKSHSSLNVKDTCIVHLQKYKARSLHQLLLTITRAGPARLIACHMKPHAWPISPMLPLMLPWIATLVTCVAADLAGIPSGERDGHAICLQELLFVNEYAIITTLGRGSFGEVKLALNTHDMTAYALKLIAKSRRRVPARTQDSRHIAEASVMSEINLMKELSHPNLVRLVEVIGRCRAIRFQAKMLHQLHLRGLTSDNKKRF